MVRQRKKIQQIKDDDGTTHTKAKQCTDFSSKSSIMMTTSTGSKENGNRRSNILFIIISIEITVMILLLLFQGDGIKYFSGRDFSNVKHDIQNRPQDDTMIHSKISESVSRRSMIRGSYQILESYHHDNNAFTQGLTYFDGYVYESTGIYGKSSVRKLDPANNFTVIQEVKIDSNFFGEGMTHFKSSEGDDLFVVLTWKEKTAFIYDQQLHMINSFSYHTQTGEGWGITYNVDTDHLIASDGSEYLHLFNVFTKEKNRKIKVHGYLEEDSDELVVKLINELEYVSPKDGTTPFILANVWMQDYILQIDPESGRIVALYDLSDLCPKLKFGREDVLNGISVTGAFDHNIVYITGKLWDKIYKIKLMPQ